VFNFNDKQRRVAEMLESANTWPEQEAVDEWLAHTGVFCTPEERHNLKRAVTAPRLEVQKERDELKTELAATRYALDQLRAWRTWVLEELDEMHKRGPHLFYCLALREVMAFWQRFPRDPNGAHSEDQVTPKTNEKSIEGDPHS
jgi:hypothetical protein